MLDWTKPYECQWRFTTVDENTWASKDVVTPVISASYSADSTTDGLETGTVSRRVDATAEAVAGWMRMEAMCFQGTSSELVELATLRFDPETSSWAGGMRLDNLRGVSTIFTASEADPLPDGAWAAKGSDGAARAAALIGEYTPAPIVMHSTLQLQDTVVFDLDSTPLDAALSILRAEEWVARQDGLGQIHIMEQPTEPSAYFATRERGMFLSGASSDANGNITYRRHWGPGIRVWDIFQANLPEIGLSGTYRVVSQRVTCGKGIIVEETVEEVL